MEAKTLVIQTDRLVRFYGKTGAVNGLNLAVPAGRCYGFFGRNGAGKTTTIKCLLNLLRPTSGTVRLFGRDPHRDEVAVKTRLAYVPDRVSVYPWMSIQQYFEFLASFRRHWNTKMEGELLVQFALDPSKKVDHLSRGEQVQVALIGALCPEPELLILDEPTSGLDPLIRREFIRTVIGAYQESDPENRTVFVSTHLIAEFEGLIDAFTIVDKGKAILTAESEDARARFKRLRCRFSEVPPRIEHPAILHSAAEGRELELVMDGRTSEVREAVKLHHPEEVSEESLTLEEIFLVNASIQGNGHVITN